MQEMQSQPAQSQPAQSQPGQSQPAQSQFGPSALATPANAVSLVRIVSLPLLIALIVGTGTEWAAFYLWIILASSDLADGWLARRQGATRSGAFLDPLADKVLVLGAMTALVYERRLWWVPVSVIAGREVAISAYRSYVGRRGVSVPARISAKAKTWIQAFTVGFALLPSGGASRDAIVLTLLWLGVAFTLVTGAQYLLDGRQVARAG